MRQETTSAKETSFSFVRGFTKFGPRHQRIFLRKLTNYSLVMINLSTAKSKRYSLDVLYALEFASGQAKPTQTISGL